MALSVGLSACGGGGSSTTTEMTPKEKCEAAGGTYADDTCTTAAELLAQRQAEQRDAISDTIDAATTAVAAVDDDATDDEVSAARTAVAAARTAISGAADVPQAEKDANTGTVDALASRLSDAVTSRQMAMDAADEAARMAAIDGARTTLTGAQDALAALADDATDEEKRDAQRMVEAAANALRDTLQMNGGSSADIEAAIRTAQTAKVAADALQTAITAAADAKAAQQMAAINAAQMTLDDAEDALAALDDDATDKEKRDAHRAVERAGATLIQVLQDNEGTATQITAATMTRDSAKMMADELTSPIEIADQRQAIKDALAAVVTAVAAVDDDATDAQVKAADDAIAAARKAIADATELPEAETDAQSSVVDAHAGILATSKTSRQAVLDAKADEEREAARVAANKVANTKKAAITAEAGAAAAITIRPFDSADAYDTSDGANNTATNYRVQVEHDGGPKVTVTDGALPADNDPQYMQTATFGNGQMLVRNIGTERMIIVLHSDIEAPEQKAFSSVYPFTVDRDEDTTADDTYAVLAADNGKIASSNFPSGASTTRTYAVYDEDGTAAARAASQFSGTFDGASGMYRCVDATDGCTVSTDAMGKFAALTADEWEFTPAAGATVGVADSDYMTYGFWLDTTTKDGEVTSYDAVQTFATSSLGTSTGLDDTGVTGTATYAGGASGVYVHETKKEDSTLDTATSGRFTADVSLEAYFDDTTLRNENTIEGTISDFDLDGGPDNSWNVNVSASFTADGLLENGVASGMTGNNGSLSGQFHGAADTVPSVLVGEFNSTFVNGTVAGAYGARKEE